MFADHPGFFDSPSVKALIGVTYDSYYEHATQGIEAFNAARLLDVPARLLYFPDENHWVLSPQNGILWQRTFFKWLDDWLKASGTNKQHSTDPAASAPAPSRPTGQTTAANHMLAGTKISAAK